MTFDDFADLVVDKMASKCGDACHAETMYARAKAGGALNDHYDNEKLWTDAEADRLAEYVLAQGKRDDDFLADFMRRIL